jgi:hydroxymethylglutaryl-CoA lyase
MVDLPSRVHIMEVGPRDGLQIEPQVVATPDKLRLIDSLAAAGLTEIEIGSFVSPRLVPQMADIAELAASIVPRPGVTYRALWLNLRGLEMALATPPISVDGLLSVSASEAFSLRNTRRGIADCLADMPAWIDAYAKAGIAADTLSVMAAFGCNFQGDIAAETVVALIADCLRISAASGASITRFALADTMGWATPQSIRRTVGMVRERWPEVAIKLHLHDTRGAAVANAVAALELGVAQFESSIGGLGGCPFAGIAAGAAGNICTEDLAFVCAEMGIETGLDLDALIAAAQLAERLVGHQLPGKLMKAGILPRPPR